MHSLDLKLNQFLRALAMFCLGVLVLCLFAGPAHAADARKLTKNEAIIHWKYMNSDDDLPKDGDRDMGTDSGWHRCVMGNYTGKAYRKDGFYLSMADLSDFPGDGRYDMAIYTNLPKAQDVCWPMTYDGSIRAEHRDFYLPYTEETLFIKYAGVVNGKNSYYLRTGDGKGGLGLLYFCYDGGLYAVTLAGIEKRGYDHAKTVFQVHSVRNNHGFVLTFPTSKQNLEIYLPDDSRQPTLATPTSLEYANDDDDAMFVWVAQEEKTFAEVGERDGTLVVRNTEVYNISAKNGWALLPHNSEIQVEEGGVLNIDCALLACGSIRSTGGSILVTDRGKVVSVNQSDPNKASSSFSIDGGSLMVMKDGVLSLNGASDVDLNWTDAEVVNYGVITTGLEQVRLSNTTLRNEGTMKMGYYVIADSDRRALATDPTLNPSFVMRNSGVAICRLGEMLYIESESYINSRPIDYSNGCILLRKKSNLINSGEMVLRGLVGLFGLDDMGGNCIYGRDYYTVYSHGEAVNATVNSSSFSKTTIPQEYTAGTAREIIKKGPYALFKKMGDSEQYPGERLATPTPTLIPKPTSAPDTTPIPPRPSIGPVAP